MFKIIVVSQFKLQRVKRSSFPPRVLKLPFVGVSSVFRLVTEYSISLSLSSIPLQFQGNIINKSIMFYNLSLLGSMDPERCPDICIMLVDPDPRSSQNTLALLVNSNYRVVTAFQGADALELLKKKKRRVDLVLMPTELPDMCTLEVLDILKSKYNMAVVMLVDTDQPSAKEEFLWNGAMFCYKKPLDSMSAATLWQHAFVKEAELFSQSLRPQDQV
ncbi:two-component response regulator ARR10-like isoform X2 [Chenopodium quinoa]|uniref:two-component response regulator ARR10-like isoform X2 n=1 Tax=Chenopodium quinoa TaxID=63459 RepID=UPI000B79005B|nr:two-component response regulator ARR10-like isoform X2 [Chenopodium quinoa]